MDPTAAFLEDIGQRLPLGGGDRVSSAVSIVQLGQTCPFPLLVIVDEFLALMVSSSLGDDQKPC